SLYTLLETADSAQVQAQISDEIRMAELNYAAYENSLTSEYPELKKMVRPGPIEIERAQELLDGETVVLEYALAGRELLMFLIGRDEVRVEQFSLPRGQPADEALISRVTRFRDLILSNAGRKELHTAAEDLFNILIKPFEELLGQYSNIIIVPDGPLAYLPFGALLLNDRYLVEYFRIKYVPSLTSLTLLDSPEPVDRKELLAVAGSQVSVNINNHLASTSRLSALPSTLMEVDSIASLFQQVSVLKEKHVSEQAIKHLLQQDRYQYVHLATHGVIDENRPSRIGLILSAETAVTASCKEDGILRSSEIFGLDLGSDMVVLSACSTGLGKVVEGEGMLGIQRSFFYA